MKATGIVRRIDDLGRVVIPKEIRRTLRIREGDPLEIYTEKDGEVIFKKYSPMGDVAEFSARICEAVHKNTGFAAAVCDRDGIIAVSGAPKKELLDKHAAPALIELLEQRTSYRYTGEGARLSVAEGSKYYLGAVTPVLSEGDLLGGVLLLAEPEQTRVPGEFEQKLIQIVASFLGKQMES